MCCIFSHPDLAYLKEYQGRYSYTPLPSIWTRAFNRVRRPLPAAVEDLRPRAEYDQTTLAAVKDIRFCEKMFNNWMAEFDSNMGGFKAKKQDEQERWQRLRSYLWHLKEDAGRCSIMTDAILKCHARFASLMAKRIDDAVGSQYKLKCDDYSEVMSLANDISAAADSLSKCVTKMGDNLKSFVSVLEGIQVTVKKKPSLVERILRWLKSLLGVITKVLAAVFPLISLLLQPVSSAAALVASALGEAAAIVCATMVNRERQKPRKNKSESLDYIIPFLKMVVPREVQNAREKLGRFDEALKIMRLESKMRAGRRVTLFGQDPGAVAKEWRGVANKYKLAVQNGAT